MKTGKRGTGNRLLLLSLLSLLSLSSFAAAKAMPAMPYGTYLVQGAFRGEYNTVMRDFGDAKIRAQRADGTVIAESTIKSANEEGVNFVLSIPVASASTPKSCKVGESLDCVLTTSEGDLDVPNSLKVDTPVRVGKVTFNCTEVKSYVNPEDGTTVDIPTAYIDEVQAWLDYDDSLDESLRGTAYNPWADYDKDGVSNYAEFLAGTIPFDDSDRLRIKDFAMKDGKLALTFEHVGGHVYSVSSADTLAKPAWGRRRVRKSADGAEMDQVMADSNDGAEGETVIYITPLGGAASEFFRLDPK